MKIKVQRLGSGNEQVHAKDIEFGICLVRSWLQRSMYSREGSY